MTDKATRPTARGKKHAAAPPELAPKARAPAKRKAALMARSGVERKKPEAKAELAGYPIGKGRRALKGIAIYMHPLAKEQLARIAREHDRTVQDLGLEALNLLFRHYGEKPIA